jgi:uncharacterized protein (TIGR02058 family)
MAKRPYIMQTGMGVDVHGADATTAARRAVDEAIRHNSLLFLGQIGLESADQIKVDVTIACPRHETVDTAAVADVLPVGQVSVRTEPGGMLANTPTSDDPMLIALAAVLLSIDDESKPG